MPAGREHRERGPDVEQRGPAPLGDRVSLAGGHPCTPAPPHQALVSGVSSWRLCCSWVPVPPLMARPRLGSPAVAQAPLCRTCPATAPLPPLARFLPGGQWSLTPGPVTVRSLNSFPALGPRPLLLLPSDGALSLGATGPLHAPFPRLHPLALELLSQLIVLGSAVLVGKTSCPGDWRRRPGHAASAVLCLSTAPGGQSPESLAAAVTLTPEGPADRPPPPPPPRGSGRTGQCVDSRCPSPSRTRPFGWDHLSGWGGLPPGTYWVSLTHPHYGGQMAALRTSTRKTSLPWSPLFQAVPLLNRLGPVRKQSFSQMVPRDKSRGLQRPRAISPCGCGAHPVPPARTVLGVVQTPRPPAASVQQASRVPGPGPCPGRQP